MSVKLSVFNYTVQNQANNSADIYIDGVIVDAETQQIMRDWWGDETSVSYKSFRDQLLKSDEKVLNIYINSYGGHVGDAMAIHDLLIELKSKGKTVNTIGRGIIASAATYILMAGGNDSEITKNSWFMVHNASGGVYGDVYTVENYAKTLRKFNNTIRDFYTDATGMSQNEIKKLMDEETWLTGEEAVNKKFVKKLTQESTFNNSISLDQWKFKNISVLNAYNSSVVEPPKERPIGKWNDFQGVNHKHTPAPAPKNEATPEPVGKWNKYGPNQTNQTKPAPKQPTDPEPVGKWS